MWLRPLVLAFGCIVVTDASYLDVKADAGSNDDAALKSISAENRKGIEKDFITSLNMHSEWEQFLLPAPSSIALMGQLVILATKQDFPLESPKSGFKKIKYKFFRPALIQVANEGWSVFNLANTNMNEIRQRSGGIPNYVKAILRFLASKKPKLIQKLVPITLKAIEDSAARCSTLAEEVRSKFCDLMQLLNELDEIISKTKGIVGIRYANASKELAVAKVEKESLDDMYNRSMAKIDRMEAVLEEDRKKYIEAINKIPSPSTELAQSIVRLFKPRNVINFLLGGPVIKFFKWAFSGFKVHKEKPSKDHKEGSLRGNASTAPTTPSIEREIDDDDVLFFANTLYLFVAELPNDLTSVISTIERIESQPTTTSQFKDKVAVSTTDASAGITDQDLLQNISSTLQSKASNFTAAISAFENNLRDKNESKYFNETVKLIRATLELTQNMSDLFQDTLQSSDKEIVIHLRDRMKGIVRKLKVLAAVQARSGSIGASPAVYQPGDKKGQRFIAAQRLNMLAENSKQYDRIYSRMKQENKRIMEVMVRISELNTKKINYDKFKKVIQEGIATLSKVKKVWTLLLQFFQMIRGIAAVPLQKRVESFLDVSNSSLIRPEFANEPEVRMVFQQETIRVSTTAEFLHTIAATYANVSERFLMRPLAALAALMKIEDPSKQKVKLKQLFNGSKVAQSEIKLLVERQKEQYEKEIAKQTASIRNMYKVIGKPTPDDLKAIAEGNKAT